MYMHAQVSLMIDGLVTTYSIYAYMCFTSLDVFFKGKILKNGHYFPQKAINESVFFFFFVRAAFVFGVDRNLAGPPERCFSLETEIQTAT